MIVTAAPPNTATRPTLQQAVLRKLSGVLQLPPPTTRLRASTVAAGADARRRRAARRPLRAADVEPGGHPAGPRPLRPRASRSRRCSARSTPRAATTWSLQSVRGTFGSGGDFDPMVHEIADGADTVAWLRDQPWFTGTFATIGLSYLGFTQWALLDGSAAGDGGRGHHRRSARRQRTTLGHRFVRPQRLPRLERPGRPPGGPARAAGDRCAGSGRAAGGTAARADYRWASRAGHCSATARRGTSRGSSTPRPTTRSGTPLQLRDALDRAEIPVLLLTGWQDLFLEQTLDAVRAAARRGVPVGADGRPVDAHPHDDQGRAHRAARIARLARHPPRRRTTAQRAVRCASTSTATGWIDLPDWPPPMPEQRAATCNRAAGSAMRCRRTTRSGRRSPTTPPTRRRRSAAGCSRPQGGYRDDTALARARRRAELHRRPAAAGPLRRRHPGARTVALVRQPAQRPVRPGQRGRRQGTAPAMSATAIGRRHTGFGHGPHRTRRGRAPVPRRIADPGAGRRRLASAVRAQPRHRRAGRHRPRAWSPSTHTVHLGEGGRRGSCCLPASSRRQPTERAHPLGDLGQRGVVVHRRRPLRVDRQLHPAGAAARTRGCGAAGPARPAGRPDTTSTVSRCLGRKSSRSARTDSAVQMCSGCDLVQALRPVDLDGGNDFRAPARRTTSSSVLSAAAGVEQVAVLGAHPLGVAVRDRREEQEPRRASTVEPLLVDAALAQQHGLPAVEQRVHRRAPLLERGLVSVAVIRSPRRARTSGRRSGGTVFGGCRRGGSPASSRVVVAVTSATAASKASTLAPDGRVMPLTLRTY